MTQVPEPFGMSVTVDDMGAARHFYETLYPHDSISEGVFAGIPYLGIMRDGETLVNIFQQMTGNPLAPIQVAAFGPKRILHNGSVMLGIGPGSGEQGDRFDEGRVGLDHLSFSVDSRDDLLRALAALDGHGVPHGEITDLPGFAISILAFRDPDNIQLELTAPYTP